MSSQTATPSVFVPLPTAPGDHQTKNAQALTQTGGGVLVPDAQLDGAKVVIMKGLAHFPMSENPELFHSYLQPVLDEIRAASKT